MDTNEILNSRTFDSDWDKNNFTRWLSGIAESFKDADIKAALSDKASLCKMFYTLKNTSVNRQKYQQVKKDIQVLQEYYGITSPIPTRDEVLETQEISVLFKDLNSLMRFINKTGSQKLDNYDENNDLPDIKAIVILGWRGIKREEVVTIKKSDLKQKENKFFITTVRGDFEITKTEYEFLVWFSSLSEYRGFPMGKRVILKGNEDYLFRSARANEDKPENSIPKALEKFNAAVSNTGKAIIFRYLRKNALFSELYEELKTIPEPINLHEQIQKKFNCDYHATIGYKTEYNLWAAKYHGSKS